MKLISINGTFQTIKNIDLHKNMLKREQISKLKN